MIRLRRVTPRVPLGRVYEIDLGEEGGSARRIVTRSPLSVLDPRLGVGDAWAVIDAANRAWDGSEGEWVSLHDPEVEPGP